MRKIAFTLAEVLITLTIIGVIAAITIPNLMQSYRKHQVEVGVKEAYSILSNALTMARAEHGDAVTNNDSFSGGYNNANEWIDQFIVPYLKINKDYRHTPPYGRNIYIMQETNYNLPGIRYLLLSNGMILSICRNYYGGLYFFIDINGTKGKNALAHDIFSFSLYQNGILRAGHRGQGHDAWFNNLSEINKNCAPDSFGTTCTTLIQKNGWKIPDDYPVKKF